MPKRLSAEERLKIREEVRKGGSRYEVARVFGISLTTVYRHTDDLPKKHIQGCNKRLIASEKLKIRQEVGKGRSRYKVAEEFGVDPKAVYYWTNDLPKKKQARRTVVTSKMERKIRKMVKSGMSRCEVAKELGISSNAVNRRTKDFQDYRGKTIKGWSLKVLKAITRDGYFIPKPTVEAQLAKQSYHVLRNHILIKKVDAGRRNIYFLEGRGREAFKAFVIDGRMKVINYRKLCKIMPLFGIHKDQYKEAVFGESPFREKLVRKVNLKNRRRSGTVSELLWRFLTSETYDLREKMRDDCV